MRQNHIFFKFSKAIQQFVRLFMCFVRVVNLKLFCSALKGIRLVPYSVLNSKQKQFHGHKSYKTHESAF